MQNVSVTQDTHVGWAWLGTAMVTLLQDEPSHISAGSAGGTGVVVSIGPTAMQKVALTHETDCQLIV
ncbi:MAG TPA: hypothetical protein VGG09_05350 [Acidimicrobiales bacterium]|jgi:hypothetical protein